MSCLTTLCRCCGSQTWLFWRRFFAAREQNTLGISSADLAREIPGAVYCPTLEDVTARLRELARPGDLILTVGAGDIYLAGEALVKSQA